MKKWVQLHTLTCQLHASDAYKKTPALHDYTFRPATEEVKFTMKALRGSRSTALLFL